MSQTGDYQGLGLPSGTIWAMFRAALVAPFGGTPVGYPTGEVVAHTNVVQNDTRVHVTLLNGLPDTQYVVSIACQRAIGSFNTNDQGNGATNIDAPGVTTGLFGDPNWFVDVRVTNTWDDYRVAGPFGVQ